MKFKGGPSFVAPTDDTVLRGETIAWAIHVLERVGFDAHAADARMWLGPPVDIGGVEVMDADLDRARRLLTAEDPTKRHFSKLELFRLRAAAIIRSPEGRKAVRHAMRQLPPDELIGILDFRQE